MRKFLLILPLLLLIGCGEESTKTVPKTIPAVTVSLLRVVCEPFKETPVPISMKEELIFEGIYKIDKDYTFYHINGKIYKVPDNYSCKAAVIPDEYACLTKEDSELLYPGPCKFTKVR